MFIDDYNKARKACTAAEISSAVSDSTDLDNKSRKRTPNRKYSSDGSEEGAAVETDFEDLPFPRYEEGKAEV